MTDVYELERDWVEVVADAEAVLERVLPDGDRPVEIDDDERRDD